MRLRGIAALALVFCTLVLAACARQPTLPPPEEALQLPETSYLIGPGDGLNIQVWRNPELSMVVPVRPDGKITTALVEDLQAAGKTSTELARDVEKALEKYIQSPVVTVIITSFIGPYSQQIRVIGEAARPQALPYRDNMSLMDVMIAVGGITDFADGNRASILRSSSGKSQQQYGVRLYDLIKRGDLTANVPMRPGDVLVIPQSLF